MVRPPCNCTTGGHTFVTLEQLFALFFCTFLVHRVWPFSPWLNFFVLPGAAARLSPLWTSSCWKSSRGRWDHNLRSTSSLGWPLINRGTALRLQTGAFSASHVGNHQQSHTLQTMGDSWLEGSAKQKEKNKRRFSFQETKKRESLYNTIRRCKKGQKESWRNTSKDKARERWRD